MRGSGNKPDGELSLSTLGRNIPKIALIVRHRVVTIPKQWVVASQKKTLTEFFSTTKDLEDQKCRSSENHHHRPFFFSQVFVSSLAEYLQGISRHREWICNDMRIKIHFLRPGAKIPSIHKFLRMLG
jgi:hypothetical protein